MSKSIKRNIQDVDVVAILAQLAGIPITSWAYEGDPDVRHIGPSSEDFFAAFGYGRDGRYIGTIDADGVAFAAIQALAQEHSDLKEEIRRLRQRLEDLDG